MEIDGEFLGGLAVICGLLAGVIWIVRKIAAYVRDEFETRGTKGGLFSITVDLTIIAMIVLFIWGCIEVHNGKIEATTVGKGVLASGGLILAARYYLYGRRAIYEYGALRGWLMVGGRIFRLAFCLLLVMGMGEGLFGEGCWQTAFKWICENPGMAISMPFLIIISPYIALICLEGFIIACKHSFGGR